MWLSLTGDYGRYCVADLVAHLAGIMILPYMVPYFIVVIKIVSTLRAEVVIRALAVVRLSASFRSEGLVGYVPRQFIRRLSMSMMEC